ncbi:MAG: hypothetical protein QOE14_2407, partial [Humisphaera sp.]|nr:hypothetical protein [Humisphaera sp.]
LYLPLLQSMVRYASGASPQDRNFLAGAEIIARFEPEVNATRGVVVRPDGSSDRCEVISAEGRSEARYAATAAAGVYTIRAGPRGGERAVMFALAPPVEESDLTPLDEPAWRRMEEQLGFTRLEPDGRPLAARVVGQRSGAGGGDRSWLAALAGVLGLFIIELALARAWSAAPASLTKGAMR